MTEKEDTIERIERVLKLTHKKSITVTIPRLTAERAVSMLKEQEAKDIKSYYGLAGGPHGACPSCCTTIPRIIGQETRFCPFCGQAVKWE